MYGVLRYAPQICNMYGVPRYLQFKDLMEQGFRYEKDCLSKKERTTCIGNGNSGENLTRRAGATARQERFNGKRARKNRYGVPRLGNEDFGNVVDVVVFFVVVFFH